MIGNGTVEKFQPLEVRHARSSNHWNRVAASVSEPGSVRSRSQPRACHVAASVSEPGSVRSRSQPRAQHVAARIAPAAFLLALALGAQAAAPGLNAVIPPGGQRGSTCEIELRGERLKDAQEILFYRPGITVTSLGVTNNVVKAALAIAPGCEPGAWPFRLRTASGLSDLALFQVGPFPNVEETEPNNEFGEPQSIPLNSTVNGVVKDEDVDHFVVTAKKGDRISAEVEGLRLGGVFFDPYLAILDTNRFELAASDDTALFRQDGAVSVLAPADGRYIVQLRESSYRGSDASRYRLHVGTFSRPVAVYPAGGRAGEEVEVRFIGDAAGDQTAKIRLPDAPSERHGVFPPGGTTPSPNPFRVVDFPNVLEAPSGHGDEAATETALAPPIALNGVIARDDERDLFRFPCQKDRSYEVRVFARQIGSPIDPVITVRGPGKGGSLGNNDDTKGLDSFVQFKAAVDGLHTISIRDHLHKGAADYVYRIEVTPAAPALAINVPIFRRESQDRQAVPVARGNRNAELLAIRREGVDGDLAMLAAGLPAGMKVTIPPIPPGAVNVPVLFEAAADAPLAGALADLTVRPAAEGAKPAGRIEHEVELVYGNPNNAVYFTTPVDRLAVAVTEDAPFRIEVEQPKTPLVQGGTLRLGVVVHRVAPFDEPVQIKLVYSPPGVNSPAEITIPKGESRGEILLQAGGDAQVRAGQTAVIASAKVGGGDLWVSSPFFALDVASPFQGGKLAMSSVEKGQTADVVMELSNLKPFEGTARMILGGLPARCTAQPVEFTKEDKSITFKVVTEEKAPVGQHKSLFCNAEIPCNGATVEQTVAVNGTLRIDAPRKKEEAPVAAQAPPPPPAQKQPVVLSRLEQLRQQQAREMSGK